MDLTEKLSRHFTLGDFYQPEAYRDLLGGEEPPKVEAKAIQPRILRLMDELWDSFEERYPGCVLVITPHGGYRTEKLNALVGGAKRSRHKSGNAADFRVRLQDGTYLPAGELAILAEHFMDKKKLRGGVGMYHPRHTYIHVDARGRWASWYGGYSGDNCPAQGGRKCVYSQGRRGAGVLRIQEKLGLCRDGIYGPLTRRAVRYFQIANGLEADGIFGEETNRAMGEDGKGLLPWDED